MNSFLVMYIAEMKKVLIKKSVWIAMIIGLALVLLMGFTNLSAEGHSVYVKNSRSILSESSGQEVNEDFLKLFQDEVTEEINNHPEEYEKLMEYDPGIGFMNGAEAIGKKALFDFVYNVVRDRSRVATVTEEEFYAMMRENIVNDGLSLGSSDEEIQEWLGKYDSIEKPMKYYYSQCYLNIVDVSFFVGWVLFLNIAIALSGVFADEKTHRTDAIILAARKGRSLICLAKILAGVTVALLQCLVICGGCVFMMLSFFGTEGAKGMIQNIIPSSPWNITIGQMMLIYIGLAVVTTSMFALTNMMMSYITRSAVATMAIHTVILFLGLFNVPNQLGVLAKLWQLRPTMALYYGTFCNTYMYGKFNNVELSFLIYGICVAILAVLLAISYKRAQVESR